MRSHSVIVRDFGATRMYRGLKSRGWSLHHATPQRWVERDNIPGEYWADLVDMHAATLAELAAAARDRKLPETIQEASA